MTVDYTPGMPELISYAAHKRHRGRIGEQVECSCGCSNCGDCQCESCEQNEALNFQQRRARARMMKKIKAKIAMGRRRAEKKPADMERLQKRANKQARSALFKKFAKGKSKSEVPAARRQEIEKRLDKMKPRIQKMARRLLPKVRQMDKERRMGKSSDEDK